MVLLTMGSVTCDAIKLAQNGAQRIEEPTGASVDEESTQEWVLSSSTGQERNARGVQRIQVSKITRP
jgi:hypothetical protein